MFWCIINAVLAFYLKIKVFLKSVGKVLMRLFTRMPEVQRIVYGKIPGAPRIKSVEDCLKDSKQRTIKAIMGELFTETRNGELSRKGERNAKLTRSAVLIAKAKEISIRCHKRFVVGLIDCLEVICATEYLIGTLEQLKKTLYDSDNLEHEKKLLELWDLMVPNYRLSGRKSRQWEQLGFQGLDPATDFRGGGILSLECFLYVARKYPDIANRLLEFSHHPRYGFPLALVIIQFTCLGFDLLQSGLAKTHFYNRYPAILSLQESAAPEDSKSWGEGLLSMYYEFVICLTLDFVKLWHQEKPRDLFDYSRVRDKFDIILKNKLQRDTTCFLLDFAEPDFEKGIETQLQRYYDQYSVLELYC